MADQHIVEIKDPKLQNALDVAVMAQPGMLELVAEYNRELIELCASELKALETKDARLDGEIAEQCAHVDGESADLRAFKDQISAMLQNRKEAQAEQQQKRAELDRLQQKSKDYARLLEAGGWSHTSGAAGTGG